MKNKYANLIAPRRFEIEEEELQMSDDQVLIKIVACGLCKGELHNFEGKRGQFPQRLGHEAAGIIEKVGKKVKEFKQGDRITGLFSKAFSAYAVTDPQYLIKIPDDVPIEYALGEPLKCCVTSIRAAQPEYGDYVSLIGCGPMGLLILSGIAKSSAAEIFAVDSIESRLVLAKELGATVVLNPTKTEVLATISEMTEGRGVDVSIEATGAPEGLELSSKILRKGRPRLIMTGYHHLLKQYDLSYLGKKGPVIHSTHPSYCLDQMDDLRRAMIGLKKGLFPMDKIITHRFSLENINEAFNCMGSMQEEYIKGIVVP